VTNDHVAAEPLLRIGELAKRAGVSPRTVDFYTSLGLLTPARRSGGNFRLYHPGDVHRITLIRRLEAQGIRLDDITHALTSPNGSDPTRCGQHPDQDCPADPDAVPGHLAVLEEQLQALRAVASTADAPTRGLLATVTARAASLITTAALLGADLATGADSLLPPL
jgi:DNA-binding transcriptional MerR regulator